MSAEPARRLASRRATRHSGTTVMARARDWMVNSSGTAGMVRLSWAMGQKAKAPCWENTLVPVVTVVTGSWPWRISQEAWV